MPQLIRIKTSLSSYLDTKRTRANWSSAFPKATACVRALNKDGPTQVRHPPSAWLKRERRFGTLGTACDYLVGLWCTRDALSEPADRLERPVGQGRLEAAPVQVLLGFLQAKAQSDGLAAIEDDQFLRGLGLLAEVDALSRSPVNAPEWFTSETISDEHELHNALMSNYPDDFVKELRDLGEAIVADLPDVEPREYDPVFGRQYGNVMIGADGDLLLDGLLLDLKVSTRSLRRDQVCQLLGYVALDRLNGNKRIHRVGTYNPRFRFRWVRETEELLRAMGGGSLDEFCEWFDADLKDYANQLTRQVMRAQARRTEESD